MVAMGEMDAMLPMAFAHGKQAMPFLVLAKASPLPQGTAKETHANQVIATAT